MRKALAVFSAILVLCVASGAVAGPSHPTLNWGSNVNASQCKGGTLVVNVTMKVINDVDSGQAGNYWAFDEFNKSIQLWAQNDGSYCVIVKFTGAKFDAQAGQTSPGNTGALDGTEDGTFEGGYWAIIRGTRLSTPTWRTKGNLGTIDYQCDLAGNCPGAIDWVAQYFGNIYQFDYGWWGWVYHNANHVWVNAVDGNSGDVR